MGIRLKLSALIFCVVTLASGTVGYIAVKDEERALRQDMETRGLQILRALAIPCAGPLANNDYNQLDNYIANFDEGEGHDLDLLWLAVLDIDGRVLAHTQPNWFRRYLQDDFTRHALRAVEPISAWDQASQRLHLAIPVGIRELRFGTLRAEMSLDRLQKRIDLLHVQGALLVGAGVLVAIGAIFFGLSRAVLSPLRVLSEGARRLGRGEFDARVPRLASGGELALLGEVFNAMAASLEEHARELERRVEERTTALTKANELLALLATTDELTGVKNHRAFQESLRVELLRSQRSGAPLSLLMIDVDYFKRFNDTHGHPAGDALLRDLARTLREHLRETDSVARYGGEEFAIILLDTGQEAAQHVAEKLRAAVEAARFAHAEQQAEGRVTISLGVACYPRDAESPKTLVESADQALYRAKREGRNRVCVASRPAET